MRLLDQVICDQMMLLDQVICDQIGVLDRVLLYLEVQIALIFCRVWSEQSASCFVWV